MAPANNDALESFRGDIVVRDGDDFVFIGIVRGRQRRAGCRTGAIARPALVDLKRTMRLVGIMAFAEVGDLIAGVSENPGQRILARHAVESAPKAVAGVRITTGEQ